PGRLGQQPDSGPHHVRAFGEIDAADPGPAGRRRDHPGQHPHGGRLARPIGSQEAEDLAGPDLHVEVTNGPALAVLLAEPFGPDHGWSPTIEWFTHALLPATIQAGQSFPLRARNVGFRL